jgi:RNA polymerase sigma-70 factor (sigma-E family)
MIASREVDAFEEFVRTSSDRLVRVAYMLTGDVGEAEDIVQTALVRTAGNWRKARRRPYPYARTAVVNLTTDRWRRLARRPREDAVDLESLDGAVVMQTDTMTVTMDIDRLVERDAILGALRRLPSQQRGAVVLRYFEDMSVEDTARALGCAPGTVKAHTSRAMQRLRIEMCGAS